MLLIINHEREMYMYRRYKGGGLEEKEVTLSNIISIMTHTITITITSCTANRVTMVQRSSHVHISLK